MYDDFDLGPQSDEWYGPYVPDIPCQFDHYDDWREDIDLDPWAEAMEDYDDTPDVDDSTDDGEALASAGFGTDEDYGYYGDDCDEYDDMPY